MAQNSCLQTLPINVLSQVIMQVILSCTLQEAMDLRLVSSQLFHPHKEQGN